LQCRTEKLDVREGKGEEESADTYNEYIFDISYTACTDQEKTGTHNITRSPRIVSHDSRLFLQHIEPFFFFIVVILMTFVAFECTIFPIE